MLIVTRAAVRFRPSLSDALLTAARARDVPGRVLMLEQDRVRLAQPADEGYNPYAAREARGGRSRAPGS